jgi:hypothetical protein
MAVSFSRVKVRVSAIAGLLLSLLLSVPSHAQQKSKADKPKPEGAKAIVLEGKSTEFASVDFIVGAQGVNAKNKLGLLIWTPTDPDYVLSLNSENKVYLHEPFEDWRLAESSNHSRLTRAELVDKPVLCGLKCTHYVGYRENRRGAEVPVVEFWSLDKSPCPTNVLAGWCRFFDLPVDYGFPIQVTRVSPLRAVNEPGRHGGHGHGHGGHWGHLFSLVSVKNSPSAVIAVKAPKGYKQAKDKAELMFSSGGTMKASDIEDLFEQPVR